MTRGEALKIATNIMARSVGDTRPIREIIADELITLVRPYEQALEERQQDYETRFHNRPGFGDMGG